MFNYGKSFYPVLFYKPNKVSSFQIFFIKAFPNNKILELIK